MTEEQILQGCRQGLREAQQELFNQTIGTVYRLLVRMTGNEDDASELAQETYLRVFTAIAEFRGQSSLKTWIFRIAMNEALQLLRKTNVASRCLRIKPPRNPADVPMDELPARELDVNAALSELNPEDRAILLLRYDQGLNYREIASALDCAEGTVASRLNRARAKLREMLADGYDRREAPARAEHLTKRKAGLCGDSPWATGDEWIRPRSEVNRQARP